MLYLYGSNSGFHFVINFTEVIVLLGMEWPGCGGVGLESHRLGIPRVSAIKSAALGDEGCSSGGFLFISLVCRGC